MESLSIRPRRLAFTVTPRDLLQRFINFWPEFETRWKSDLNYHRGDDGSFTLHGVCGEFSNFFRDTYATWSDSTLSDLFEFVEWNLVEPDAEATLLDNALCTCFLENISSEPCGQAAKPLMGRKSRAFFDQWHVGQND